jgi:hypothetical protein
MNIDFFKYKRFFAFGCSFTKYHCPSWSDLISKEMPNAEYVNFGLPVIPSIITPRCPNRIRSKFGLLFIWI